MFTTNLFSGLSAVVSPAIMQGYIILMVLLVMGGTILDMMHKKARSTFSKMRKKRSGAQNGQWVQEKRHRLRRLCW